MHVAYVRPVWNHRVMYFFDYAGTRLFLMLLCGTLMYLGVGSLGLRIL